MTDAQLYPEHAKLTRTGTLSEFTNQLGAWLDTTAHAICRLACELCDDPPHEGAHRSRLHEPRPVYRTVGLGIEALLADIFEVDLAALEREKRAMLDSLRQAQAGQQASEPEAGELRHVVDDHAPTGVCPVRGCDVTVCDDPACGCTDHEHQGADLSEPAPEVTSPDVEGGYPAQDTGEGY